MEEGDTGNLDFFPADWETPESVTPTSGSTATTPHTLVSVADKDNSPYAGSFID